MRLPSFAVARSVGGCLVAAAALLAPAPPATRATVATPWINEIHYDNAGTDTSELVEIAGPAGTSLGGWRLVGYDAKKGKSYVTLNLSGTIPVQQGQSGTLAFAFAGLQDGSPDGVALVDAGGAVVEFLSYEGTFQATNGPALGQTSKDIGVSESSSTPVGRSLQRAGTGTTAADFTWQPAGPHTAGLPNTGQSFGAPADTTPPAIPTGLSAVGGDASVGLDWSDNAEADLDGYLVRRGTASGGPYVQLTPEPIAASTYVDVTVVNGTTYRYVVEAVDVAGNASGATAEVSALPQPPGGPPPAGLEYFVSPGGNDSNPGSSIALPWKTFAHALPLLKAGDTLTVRSGTYLESGLLLAAAGTANAPITIRNHPGEHPVVDGAYPEFMAAGNQAWELVDAAKSIWRSVGTYPGADAVYGFYGPDNGSWRLVPYEDYGPFSTDNEDFADQPPYYYIGPGVFWNPSDSRIYYRGQRSKYQVADGIAVPANPDPRQTPLFLFPEGDVLALAGSAGHVVIEGLELRHRYDAIELKAGAHHVTVRDCSLRGGRYHLLVRGGAHDLTFDGVTVADSFPSWVAWTDVKYPSEGRPGHLLQGAAIQLEDAVDRVEIAGCTLTGVFDAIGAPDTPTNLRVHHTLFDARDDVMQLGTAGWNIEFDHNRTLRAHSAGPARNGSGAPPAGQAGTVWIHHNVLDASALLRLGRTDPLGLLDDKFQGPAGDGFGAGRTFASHSADVPGPVPWKIYHNTALVNDDINNGGVGQAYVQSHFDPAVPQEVFNNVFVQLGNEWLLRDARLADGSQAHDGNLYWAPNRAPGTSLLEDLWQGATKKDFASLAAFRASPSWNATKSTYPPGWEASGIEADPLLDAQLQPGPGSPAASGAIDLSSKGWPGLAGETFRGALPPKP